MPTNKTCCQCGQTIQAQNATAQKLINETERPLTCKTCDHAAYYFQLGVLIGKRSAQYAELPY